MGFILSPLEPYLKAVVAKFFLKFCSSSRFLFKTISINFQIYYHVPEFYNFFVEILMTTLGFNRQPYSYLWSPYTYVAQMKMKGWIGIMKL